MKRKKSIPISSAVCGEFHFKYVIGRCVLIRHKGENLLHVENIPYHHFLDLIKRNWIASVILFEISNKYQGKISNFDLWNELSQGT